MCAPIKEEMYLFGNLSKILNILEEILHKDGLLDEINSHFLGLALLSYGQSALAMNYGCCSQDKLMLFTE